MGTQGILCRAMAVVAVAVVSVTVVAVATGQARER